MKCFISFLVLALCVLAVSADCESDLQSMRIGKYPSSSQMHIATGKGDYGWNNQLNHRWSLTDPGVWRQCERLGDNVAHYCFIQDTTSNFTVGACVPSSCSESDLASMNSTLLIEALRLPDSGFDRGELFIACETYETKFPWHSILVIAIISLLFFMVFVGAVLEYLITNYPEKFSKNGAGYDNLDEHKGLLDQPQRRRDDSTSSTGSAFEYDVDYANEADLPIGINAMPPQQTLAEIKDAQPLWFKFLMCWAPMHNYSRLLSIPPGNQNLRPLNFLRVMSITMVIFGHSWYFFTKVGVRDPYSAEAFLASWPGQIVVSMTYSVDQFLMLGGLLVCYLFLKTAEVQPVTIKTWFLYYFHRVFRLTPAMFMALVVWWQIAPYLGSGPFWAVQQQTILNQCNSYWWTNLLYINNLYPSKIGESCFGWGWYLAVDMQYYIVTPILLVAFMKFQKIGLGFSAVLLFAVWTMCIILSAVNNLSANKFMNALGHDEFSHALDGYYGDYPNLIYYEPWSRAAPYLLGILIAFFLYTMNGRIPLPKAVRYPGYAISVLTLAFLTFITYTEINYGWNRVEDVINIAFSRTAWVAAIGFLMVCCISGYCAPVRMFTSMYMWIPLARLTYAAYLYHPILIQLFYGSSELIPMYTGYTPLYCFMSNWVFAFFVSFLNFMALEKPMMNIEMLLLSLGKTKR